MHPVTNSSASAVNDQIQELAQFNSDPDAGGITREIFTAQYTSACDYVSELMKRAGLAVRTDSFGNLFGRLIGTDPEAPLVLTGSHIDTTLNAGAYDGVLGVLGAIEAARLIGLGEPVRRSIEVVAFAGEEPRFGSGCIGSRAMAGSLSRADIDTMRDRDGVSIADAMRYVGLDPDRLGEARIDPAAVHCFVELHIEQGSVLETHDTPIGVVTHIAAPHDLLIRIRGAAAHAGATPMGLRRDALAGAAEAMVALEAMGRASPSGTTVATTGVIRAHPGAINVVPGEVELEIDIRDVDLDARTAVVNGFLEAVSAIAARRGLQLDVATITRDEPAAASPQIVAATRASCDELGAPFMEMVSGAYHDAMVIGAQVPMGMIFVPSAGGISHSPLEYTAPAQVDCGVAVLARTLRILADAR